jgi:hypothetical protein
MIWRRSSGGRVVRGEVWSWVEGIFGGVCMLLAVLSIGCEDCRDSDSVVGLSGLDSVRFE